MIQCASSTSRLLALAACLALTSSPTSVCLAQSAAAQLVITGPRDGCVVRVDGAEVGATPIAAPVSPGSHLVEVTCADAAGVRRVATVSEGSSSVVDFGVSDEVPAVPPPPSTPLMAPVPPPTAATMELNPPTSYGSMPLGAGRVRIIVEGETPGIVLSREAGIALIPGLMVTRSGTVPTLSRRTLYERLCAAPCELSLETGEYRFGLSIGDSDNPLRVRGTYRADHDARLSIAYVSHSGERVAGYLVLGFGVAGGVALAVTTLLIKALSFRGPGWGTGEDIAQLVSGSVIAVASLVVGLIFGLRRDETSVTEIQF